MTTLESKFFWQCRQREQKEGTFCEDILEIELNRRVYQIRQSPAVIRL
jgi:hypothetical protein